MLSRNAQHSAYLTLKSRKWRWVLKSRTEERHMHCVECCNTCSSGLQGEMCEHYKQISKVVQQDFIFNSGVKVDVSI